MGKMKPTYKMPFRRRREGKTNYAKRLRLLSSGKPRLVARRSLKYIQAQVADYDETGDRIIASANSKELQKLGWKFSCKNTPAAYLTGLLVGRRALAAKISSAVLDTGLYGSTKGSKLYALAKGVIDAGLKVPCGEEVLPAEERIKGLHIANREANKEADQEGDQEKFKDLPEEFEKVKGKILSGEKSATKEKG
jgi:large subunit ribosomal protein L18